MIQAQRLSLCVWRMCWTHSISHKQCSFVTRYVSCVSFHIATAGQEDPFELDSSLLLSSGRKGEDRKRQFNFIVGLPWNTATLRFGRLTVWALFHVKLVKNLYLQMVLVCVFVLCACRRYLCISHSCVHELDTSFLTMLSELCSSLLILQSHGTAADGEFGWGGTSVITQHRCPKGSSVRTETSLWA